MIRNSLKVLAAKLRHPFPVFSLLPGHLFSLQDAAAERLGRVTVEEFFATSQPARNLGRALSIFLNDRDGELALRKEMHRMFEERLRAVALHVDPANRYRYGQVITGGIGHPLDAVLALKLGVDGQIPPARASQRFMAWMNIFLRTFLLLSRAVVLPLRFGCLKRPLPVRARVFSPHIANMAFWRAYRESCEDLGHWSQEALQFVNETNSRASDIANTSEPNQFRIPIVQWLRCALFPALSLAVRVIWECWKGRTDPRVVEAATRSLSLANTALEIWRTALNIRGQWYLDSADYSAAHILKAIIFRKVGIRLVRFPFSEVENPGFSYSFLGYDVFMSGGFNHAHSYGDSWRRDCKAVPLGLYVNDRRLLNLHIAEPEQGWVKNIEERLARGAKMVVFFEGNDRDGFREVNAQLMAIALDTVTATNGWFLVIKQKKHAGSDYFETHRRNMAMKYNGRVVFVPPAPDGGPVSARWFIERMVFGVTMPGSVLMESLALGRPMMVYFPILQTTPTMETMRQAGLAFDDPAIAAKALYKWISGNLPDLPHDWIRSMIDPFQDGRSIDRLVEFLYADQYPVPPEDKARPAAKCGTSRTAAHRENELI